LKDRTFKALERFVDACIRHRTATVAVIGTLTLCMLVLASGVQIKTVFEDLLPRSHPYVRVHERFGDTFGGSNVVSLMLEVEQGDIFKSSVLEKVRKVTRDLQQVEGVNQFQIISLASKKLRDIRGSTDSIESKPLMWPEVPQDTESIQQLKQAVIKNPLVYGAYVSRDLKAALVTVDFYQGHVNYKRIFEQIGSIADSVRGDGVQVSVVGEPVLYGWVDHYLPETLNIFLFTIAALILLLFIVARTWRGTLLPLLAGTVSAVWALGAARLAGFNLDPLVIVIAFLITARAISHSVQLVTRFDDEIASGVASAAAAAKASMLQLFKPGMLGVIADAGCMLVVVLTPIPLLRKVSLVGTVWVSTIAISACVLTPVLLSWIKNPRKYAHGLNLDPVIGTVLNACVGVVTTRWRYVALTVAAATLVLSGIYAFNIRVGDVEPGSPILWPSSTYNRDTASINRQFQGADRMQVVFAANKPDGIKDPAVLDSMAELQNFMSAQPEVGGSLSIADVIPAVKSVLREGSPRYAELGVDARENGELMYLLSSNAEPGDMARFVDAKSQHAVVTFFFRDHQGETIRTAIGRVKEYVDKHRPRDGEYLLAGGLIGVLAAVNEVIFSGQIESIALALLVLVICCAVAYRSVTAGMFFMVPVVLSNTVTFSYMAWKDIGMNLSTLPVAALGIGLGVDYSFYIVDGIREELHRHKDLQRAIVNSLHTAGRGVLVTALTLTTSVLLWMNSSLRFQADMGVLMAIWLLISAASALFLMPAMVYVFRPEFVVGAVKGKVEESGIRAAAA
jgi:predicted RND superfamily exporter protein